MNFTFLYGQLIINKNVKCFRHVESEVIPVRQKHAKSVRIKRWDKSPHVGHLRANKKEYEAEIEQFLVQLKFIK